MRGIGGIKIGAAAGAVALFCVFAGVAGVAGAQTVQSQVLIVDSEKLFSDSAYGRRIEAEITTESAALETENRRIEAELEAEEKALTATRTTTVSDVFRPMAEAFDAKVTQIRTEQANKARTLQQRSDQARRRFLGEVGDVLETIMQDAGAAVILEQRSVFFSARAVDVTAEAVARLDAAIGDGSGLPAQE
jgi:Skp family chaperone for outer membrane proteins